MDIKTLSVDIETYSSVDLGNCGVHKYVEAEDFDVLLFGYAINGEPAVTVDFALGEKLPSYIYEALYDPEVEKTAYNAAFERTCLSKYFDRYCEPAQWNCTMVLAASCGLPLSLKAVGEALELGEDKAKMKVGTDLIRYFCLPCKPTKANGQRTRNLPEHDMEKWNLFKEYNIRDVDVENTIRKQLIKWRPSFSEHKIWCVDQKINDRGMGVDVTLATNAIKIGENYKARLLEQAKDISGLDNPNSTSQIKTWLEEQEGVEVLSLNKKAVADVVANLNDDKCKQFMELRSEFSKSSTKKYEAILRYVTQDNHVHGCFRFNGAGRTGRWAGQGVQLQNLPQNHMEDLDVARQLVVDGDEETFNYLYPNVQATLSELIRTSFIPEEGHRFIVSDFSAIEARVIAWIAGEEWRLETFRNGGDIYCASASQAFKVPVEKHGQNAHLRQKGKIMELACGYGGGVGAMKAFGADKLGMTEEDMINTVDLWRSSSPHITELWRSVEKAAKKCIATKSAQISSTGNILFEYEDGVMWMTLPSSRRIAYWGASIIENKFGNKSIGYMGQDQTTKKWVQLETFGGKLVENLVQATARDVLKEVMLTLDKEGFDIRGHVHDEVIVSEPIGGRTVEDVCEIFGREISWAKGLPLRGDGYECTSYRKD